MNCALPKWLPLFERVTLKTTVIPLDRDFVDYLNADGIQLPVNADGEAIDLYKRDATESDVENFQESAENEHLNSCDPDLLELAQKFQQSFDDSDEEGTDGGSQAPAAVHFPQLDAKIRETIAKYDGAVFPKLDWSAPRDACWIATTGSLKCTNPTDVYLLLKSSDFIAHDLSQQNLDSSCQFHLCLRKWYDLHPAMEFRCFVRQHQLIAWCQRDHQNYYPFLPEMKKAIHDAIVQFYQDNIRHKFFDESEFVLDLYLVRADDDRIKRVWLVDINPWCEETTDPLLFQWNELRISCNSAPNVQQRVIQSEEHARQYQHCNPKFFTNMLPREAIAIGQYI